MNNAYSHVFKIFNSGNITCTGSATMANNINISGATSAVQSLYFRSTYYNSGIAGGAGNYSSSAAANDMILRTLTGTRLILQSGSGGHAILINSSNNIGIQNTAPWIDSNIGDCSVNVLVAL